MAQTINDLLISKVDQSAKTSKGTHSSNKLGKGEVSEFQNLLNKGSVGKGDKAEVSLSTHAAKRLQERQIDFDGSEYLKIKEALGKLKNKGGKDSLVITSKAAYVVDVKNNKIVTAVDKDNMSENVFTKIDSTVFVN